MAWSPSSTVPTSCMPGTLRMASSKSMRSSSESSASRTEYIAIPAKKCSARSVKKSGKALGIAGVMSRSHRRGGDRGFIGQKIEMAPPLIQRTREEHPFLDAGRFDDEGIYAQVVGGVDVAGLGRGGEH